MWSASDFDDARELLAAQQRRERSWIVVEPCTAALASGVNTSIAAYETANERYKLARVQTRDVAATGETKTQWISAVDTEFTALTANAKLISIGLVDETGKAEFYAELSDTYELSDCSDFCRRQVIPQLQGNDVRLRLVELQMRLRAWLAARGPRIVLVCDSRRDVVQILSVFPAGMPETVSVEVLGWLDNLRRRTFNYRGRMHRRLGLRAHHALDDARVNRLVLQR
jgi:hypothetical protein